MISKRVTIVVTVVGIFGLIIAGVCATQPEVALAKEKSPGLSQREIAL
ncbi:MAG: hypothetical protein JRI70_11910 [Deltaproteobacteria bacterium]|nr:hypothetical protein [Deltaproteobacteria bacterium]